MKRPLRHEELALWAKVAATIRPAAGRVIPTITPPPTPVVVVEMPGNAVKAAAAKAGAKGPAPKPKPAPKPPGPALQSIEPSRMRRLTRERDDLGPRLDLHGMTQDEARARLVGFLRRAHEDGWRAAMVITGKGSRGDGVLRRYTPEWLAGPELRDVVAGVAEAHRRHGGEGALYVALKRRVRD
jgi:DNA-nicking Smr family endonuclease